MRHPLPPSSRLPVPTESASENIAPVRVVIIEDLQTMAEMLDLLCTHHWGLQVLSVEHSGEPGLNAVARGKPDIVLLDIGLPDIDGLTLIPHLRRVSPASKIIVMSSLINDYVLGRLEELRWDGILDKLSDGLVFIREAIQVVRSGGRFVSPSTRRQMTQFRNCNNPFHHMLSDREKQVLTCVARAFTDGEISDRLGIDISTAHSHRKNQLKKLNQHSTPKLMHHAIRHGYASLPLPEMQKRN
jgi:two-component system, NarL family, response regulator NreC